MALGFCGLYYKNMTNINDDCKCRYNLEHHARVLNYSPTVVNLLSVMLLEHNYSSGITDDNHLQSSNFYSTSHCGLYYKNILTIVSDDRK
jgi:hypothetical protein